MSAIYEHLGIRQIVNAKGPSTRLSGGPMRPEVAQAMAEAAGLCVDIVELQAAASAAIARHSGAEAGLVTSGAAAGLMLGAAACIAGLDPAAMAKLPDTRGLKNRFIMTRSQRNQYDHAVRASGAEIVEVGLPDRYAGAGCRDAEPWEIEAAIDERTAGILHVADAASRPSLAEIVAIAHAHGLPVLVDAAAQLPPAANLRRLVESGADLIAVSGGKAIGGPQASGILCGRRDLVASAALQMFDMDYPAGLFTPPAAFIEAGRLKGLPPHGIGRACKVGKEQIVGLLVALELFMGADEAAVRDAWAAAVQELAAGLRSLNGIAIELRLDARTPALALTPHAMPAAELLGLLVRGQPAIQPDPEELDQDRLVFRPSCFVPGDVQRIIDRLHAILREGNQP
jgi:D-glucosaminate-6-phosphate ammonia-lyase